MKITIQSANNGYVVTSQCGDDSSDIAVCEGFDTDVEISLLNTIVEFTGIGGDRYAEKKIRVICMPGDKFEGLIDKSYLQELKDLRDQLNSVIEDQDVDPSEKSEG